MESYMSYLGALGSAASMAATMYFWLVRVRREQPCLKPYLIDKDFFLGLSRDNVRQIGVKVGVIVANYSLLPNAILGARLWVRLKDGWQEVGQITFDMQTTQPFNIPPQQTVLLRLNGVLTFPYQDALEDGSKTTANYLNLLAKPLEMKLDLRHLNQRADVHLMTSTPEQEQASRPVSAAA
jgi:hypothetical protein